VLQSAKVTSAADSAPFPYLFSNACTLGNGDERETATAAAAAAADAKKRIECALCMHVCVACVPLAHSRRHSTQGDCEMKYMGRRVAFSLQSKHGRNLQEKANCVFLTRPKKSAPMTENNLAVEFCDRTAICGNMQNKA